jgi:hypothetical protein
LRYKLIILKHAGLYESIEDCKKRQNWHVRICPLDKLQEDRYHFNVKKLLQKYCKMVLNK